MSVYSEFANIARKKSRIEDGDERQHERLGRGAADALGPGACC